ncbi:hypothetical protein MKX50_10695 [Paenibacillus sp. FSL W8-0186]
MINSEGHNEETIIRRLNAFNEERIEEDRKSQKKRELESTLINKK